MVQRRRGQPDEGNSVFRQLGLDELEEKAAEVVVNAEALGRNLPNLSGNIHSAGLESSSIPRTSQYSPLEGFDHASLKGPHAETVVDLHYSGYKPRTLWERFRGIFFTEDPQEVSLELAVQKGLKKIRIAEIRGEIHKSDDNFERVAAAYLRSAVAIARAEACGDEVISEDRERLFEEDLIARAVSLTGRPRIQYFYESAKLAGSLEASVQRGQEEIAKSVRDARATIVEESDALKYKIKEIHAELASKREDVDAALGKYKVQRAAEIDRSILDERSRAVQEAEGRLAELNTQIERRKDLDSKPYEEVLGVVDGLFEDYNPEGTKHDINHAVRTQWAHRIHNLGVRREVPLTHTQVLGLLTAAADSLRTSRKYTRPEVEEIIDFVEKAARTLQVSYVDVAASRIRQVGETRGGTVQDMYDVIRALPGSVD